MFTTETPKKPRDQAYKNCNRLTWILRSSPQTFRAETSPRCWRTKEQSRRMFTRSNTKTRTKSTKVSICEERPKVTFSPRSNLQSLQSSTPSHLKKHAPKIQATSSNRMEFRDGINLRVIRHPEGNCG